MKRFKYILLLGFIIIAFSCEKDLLDKKPLDKFSELDVWTNVDLAQAYMNNVYSDALGLYYGQTTDDWTDNVMLSDFGLAYNSMYGSLQDFYVQAGVFTSEKNLGWNQYSKIRKCNLAIEKLTGNENILESSRIKMIAEAKMMRAMIYFWMARRFGGLMIVDKVLTPDDELQLSRSSERDTYDFIIKDIEEATVDLPATAPQGQLTKDAAYAFLSRVALQIGDYDKVIEAADKVEEGSAVLDDYFNVCKSFGSILSSPEVILSFAREKQYNSMTQTYHQRMLPGLDNGVLAPGAQPLLNDFFTGWLQLYPPQELVDAYLFIDGDKAIQKKGVDFIGQPSHLMWQNRDARFETSIVHDSSMFFNSMVTTRSGGNMNISSRPSAPGQSPYSGYVYRKFIFEDETPDNSYPMNFALPIIRLGEVYLNKAEAYYRKGNLLKAVEYTNKTRTRHGELPPLNEGISSSEFYKYYKIERRVELMYEDDRYWSLIRWAKADNASAIPELEGVLHVIDIAADGTVADIKPWPHIAYSMVFEFPKRLYFPVPITEIRNNPNLNQNPGW
jgi:starch-binding outer membrane protein, SusD/RagB family